MGGVEADVRKIGYNVDGSIDQSKRVSMMQTNRTSTLTKEQLTQLNSLLLTNQAQEAALEQAIQNGQASRDNVSYLAQVKKNIADLSAALGAYATQPSPTMLYTDAANRLISK
jgi:hypothetical protein